jgi:hypothetical protein
MTVMEVGASVGFCSYFDAPKTEGISWKRIISSPADTEVEAGAAPSWARATTGNRTRTAASKPLDLFIFHPLLVNRPPRGTA